MPRTSYQTCKLIIQQLKARGFNAEVPINEVLKVIRLVAGAEERTVKKYTHLLEEFGMLRRKNIRIAEFVEGVR